MGTKFGLIIGVCTLLVMTLGFAAVSRRMQAEDAAQSESLARGTALRICEAVRGVFQNSFGIVDTMSDSLIALKDAGVSDPHAYDAILKQMIESGDNFGAWLSWDGAVQPLGGTQRLAIYWHQNGMEMLRDAVPADILDSDLYRTPYKSGRPYLLEPHTIAAADGDPTLVTSFAKSLEHDGRIVGVLALDLKLGAIADALDAIKLPTGAAITVVSDGGIVAMSTTKRQNGLSLAVADPAMMPLFAQARRGDGSSVDANAHGAGVLSTWSAIHAAGVRTSWYLLMKVPERSLLATMSDDRLFQSLVAAFAILSVLSTALFAMNRLVAVPLGRLSAIIDGLGQGIYDDEVPGRDRTDEVGDIARAVEKLRESGLEIARLQEESGESEYRRQLARRAELDAISARFSRSIETVVATVGRVAATVGSQSSAVATNTQEAVRRLDEVSDASAIARSNLATVAVTTRALLATIQEIGDRTREGRTAAEKVERQTACTDKSISRLRQAVGEIDSVAALIKSVAEQINLIALNATIEAARAGEAGRGFAVVAQEIKSLVGQTAKATTEISGHIGSVHQASREADASLQEMNAAFAELHRISAEVAGALEVQLDATGEISGLVGDALGSADGVARHLLALVESSQDVRGAAHVMREQSDALDEGITGLSGEVASFLGFLKAS